MDLFLKIYGPNYPFKSFYDPMWLTKSIYSDDNIFMVAKEKKKIIGTGSVYLTAGGFSDLIGEFGRLVVDPDFGKKGAGSKIMKGLMDSVGHTGSQSPHAVQISLTISKAMVVLLGVSR